MKDYTPFVRSFAELTTEELYEILKARFTVFVEERHCFYLDMDDIDYRSLHVSLREGRLVVAYARLFKEEDEADDGLLPTSAQSAWRIGRVLTVRRGAGLGRLLMEKVVETARQHGATILKMDAQVHAIGFYEKLGFHVCSDEFEEAGIPHVRMEQTV